MRPIPLLAHFCSRKQRISGSEPASMTLTMGAPMPWRSFARGAVLSLFAVAFFAGDTASAQDTGTVNPQPLPALAKPDDPKMPAKELFGRKTSPAHMQARTIGSYAKGCLAGAVALPINGETWQVMRVSRNRNWGHPSLLEFLERLSERAARSGWPGLLLGDMSQPRGGAMLNGHASHQIGFVWGYLVAAHA